MVRVILKNDKEYRLHKKFLNRMKLCFLTSILSRNGKKGRGWATMMRKNGKHWDSNLDVPSRRENSIFLAQICVAKE